MKISKVPIANAEFREVNFSIEKREWGLIREGDDESIQYQGDVINQ